ncbi:hypothetical protein EPUS_06949 [Endocarpon pusillum Z07020]|uniref:Uncharacterized protein n=1 Tax=Endocarpon pusillum (strain Z07020 / HMAS-L-300199) TaxID=1263415 RepID=U1GWB9_ENDPU|nr:uncharacterized protein EPUS_06949 [Endocarpon pusillum Z07020]ERF76391.1 hypothetical protein EPUS_06949 [Endocarpon pusillum Z07020]
MVAMKSLVVLLPFFLSMAVALPPIPAAYNETAPLSAEAWDVSALDGSVNVNFYEDKNPDSSTKIDPNTCRGKAIIALMKWRSNCKTFNAIFRSSCYTHAPSHHNCCPVPHKKSCTHYWPKPGEWEECLRMRRECGRDCHWKTLTNSVQWCWKYAPDI